MCVADDASQLSPVDGRQRAKQEVGQADREERKEQEEQQVERTSVAEDQEGVPTVVQLRSDLGRPSRSMRCSACKMTEPP